MLTDIPLVARKLSVAAETVVPTVLTPSSFFSSESKAEPAATLMTVNSHSADEIIEAFQDDFQKQPFVHFFLTLEINAESLYKKSLTIFVSLHEIVIGLTQKEATEATINLALLLMLRYQEKNPTLTDRKVWLDLYLAALSVAIKTVFGRECEKTPIIRYLTQIFSDSFETTIKRIVLLEYQMAECLFDLTDYCDVTNADAVAEALILPELERTLREDITLSLDTAINQLLQKNKSRGYVTNQYQSTFRRDLLSLLKQHLEISLSYRFATSFKHKEIFHRILDLTKQKKENLFEALKAFVDSSESNEQFKLCEENFIEQVQEIKQISVKLSSLNIITRHKPTEMMPRIEKQKPAFLRPLEIRR